METPELSMARLESRAMAAAPRKATGAGVVVDVSKQALQIAAVRRSLQPWELTARRL